MSSQKSIKTASRKRSTQKNDNDWPQPSSNRVKNNQLTNKNAQSSVERSTKIKTAPSKRSIQQNNDDAASEMRYNKETKNQEISLQQFYKDLPSEISNYTVNPYLEEYAPLLKMKYLQNPDDECATTMFNEYESKFAFDDTFFENDYHLPPDRKKSARAFQRSWLQRHRISEGIANQSRSSYTIEDLKTEQDFCKRRIGDWFLHLLIHNPTSFSSVVWGHEHQQNLMRIWGEIYHWGIEIQQEHAMWTVTMLHKESAQPFFKYEETKGGGPRGTDDANKVQDSLQKFLMNHPDSHSGRTCSLWCTGRSTELRLIDNKALLDEELIKNPEIVFDWKLWDLDIPNGTTQLYDEKHQQTWNFPNASQNLDTFSPHGNIQCVLKTSSHVGGLDIPCNQVIRIQWNKSFKV